METESRETKSPQCKRCGFDIDAALPASSMGASAAPLEPHWLGLSTLRCEIWTGSRAMNPTLMDSRTASNSAVPSLRICVA